MIPNFEAPSGAGTIDSSGLYTAPASIAAGQTVTVTATSQAKAVGYDLTVTAGEATTYEYAAHGNLKSKADPLNRLTKYTYDALGRRKTVTPPVPPGEPAQTIDELRNIRNFSYDANFWPKSATDTIDGQTATAVSFTFNPNGTMQAKAVGYGAGSVNSKVGAGGLPLACLSTNSGTRQLGSIPSQACGPTAPAATLAVST